ncbi:Uncharacterised protein [Mycobacteroides abscessus subsp. bolletii]|uniref:three-Cys-motif partner protein TcmP n=1 Tax=Mycobacteroides abscessus TaxID=36809 RepID=UPI0009A76323|nr:three-Cys-motif partner protein TcmP [Mycobacteroides abscessus]SKG68428.1 Uncharacterised protein [Mycobacteroides abscessus subsp. bolletii]SLF40198.1 Uncharacterised protein [Mycobacteroides abscessus subsp. bolletii]
MTRKEEIRDNVDYSSDAHTRLKHAFYRRYIACWMGRVLQGKWAADATIVEGFSGSGRYIDGLDGSAVMIAKLYREHILSERFRSLTFVTNDLDPARTQALNTRLDALPAEPRLQHVSLEPSMFESIVAPVQKAHAAAGRRTLWIIDPFGLKQIPWTTVDQCVRRPKNDAIITLMLDELHRFRTNTAMEQVMTETFGTDQWKNLPKNLSTAESKGALVELYCARLKRAGCLTGSFNIHVRGRPGRYALIFATHHTAGLDCWNDATWSADPGRGKGASAATGFEPTLFDPDLAELDVAFESLTGTYPFEELVNRARQLGFKPPHVRSVLDDLYNDGLAFRVSPADSGPNSPWPSGCTVRIYSRAEIQAEETALDFD